MLKALEAMVDYLGNVWDLHHQLILGGGAAASLLVVGAGLRTRRSK